MCGVPDQPDHWLRCPKYSAERAAIVGWPFDHADDPQSFRSPWAIPWKKLLLSI
jgi:hypothetical protein